jgi:hypothetical protein
VELQSVRILLPVHGDKVSERCTKQLKIGIISLTAITGQQMIPFRKWILGNFLCFRLESYKTFVYR